jgi:hypothetical protein
MMKAAVKKGEIIFMRNSVGFILDNESQNLVRRGKEPADTIDTVKMPRARAGAGAAAAAALRLRKKNDNAPIQKAQQTQQTGPGLKSQSVSDAFQRAASGESPISGRVALDKRAREEEEKRKKSFFSSFFKKKEERGMFNRTYDMELFADRDLNADGIMTFEELRVFMQNQDPEVSEAQVREKLAAVDTKTARLLTRSH